MSTRCHIIVRSSKDEPVGDWSYIYHHFDGYPEGVGAELRTKLKECIEKNAYGHKYTQQDIVGFILDIDDGYEPDDGLHGDEEYVYTATLDDDREGVKLDCYSVAPFGFDMRAGFFCMDNGYESVFTQFFHNMESGLMDNEKEKKYMKDFKENIQKLHNIEIMEMLRIICDELTLRETE